MCALVTGVQTCALPIYRIGNLERSDLDQRARDVVGRGGGEELLREARRAEAGRGRSAQRHARHDLEARGDLAVQRVAEIRIMLVAARELRSEEHTSELQSLMRISYAVFCLKKKTTTHSFNALSI